LSGVPCHRRQRGLAHDGQYDNENAPAQLGKLACPYESVR
jgi:hypothetical protein